MRPEAPSRKVKTKSPCALRVVWTFFETTLHRTHPRFYGTQEIASCLFRPPGLYPHLFYDGAWNFPQAYPRNPLGILCGLLSRPRNCPFYRRNPLFGQLVESLEGGSTHVRRKASVVESVMKHVSRGANIVKFNGAGS